MDGLGAAIVFIYLAWGLLATLAFFVVVDKFLWVAEKGLALLEAKSNNQDKRK